MSDAEQTSKIEEVMPENPQDVKDTSKDSQVELPLYGRGLSNLFNKLSETLVYTIAPQDILIHKIESACRELEAQRLQTIEDYAKQLSLAEAANDILQSYRLRPKLYTLEERLMLIRANDIIEAWRANLANLSKQQQQ